MTVPSRMLAAVTATALCGLAVVALGSPATAATAPPAAGTDALTAAPAAATPPSPQGPLTADGHRVVGCSPGCDLFAQAGSWTASVSASIPIWGFTAAAGDPVAAVGPTLLVNAGDPVALTVHNNLPGTQALSLAVPGMTGLASDLDGVAVGATTTYTFTPSRPGTYLYEAGHTPNGARQASMGLVGALVVRGTGSSAYSTPASAFDDEAVIVLSEIDPAFNADPLGFDLRHFAPKYRLVNGKTFPQTDEVATDKARTVLLRYVNAGAVSHAMGLLGVQQTVIGEDAHAAPAPARLTSATITPGQSVDALVTMPDTEAKYALAESAGQLNDLSSTDGSGRQAFGGMLTFLDTNAAPPTGDVFGPVSSAVTAAPATATMSDNFTVTANFSDTKAGGSNIASAEYVIDDPTLTVGGGTPLAPAAGAGTPTWTGATSTVPVSSLVRLDPVTGLSAPLAAGRHVVYVRAGDAAGNWGPIGSAVFLLKQTGPVTTGATASPTPTNGTVPVALDATGDDTAFGGKVTAAEYYLDTAPATGQGKPMTLNRQATVVAETATIPVADLAQLSEGVHRVYIRSQDALGLWGDPAAVDLVIDTTGPGLTSSLASPSPNNGTLGSPVDPTQMQVQTHFTDTVSPIAGAEGFLDNASGANGTGDVMLANDGAWSSASEDAYGLVPLSEFTALSEGTHNYYVHAQDAAGNWGALKPVPFVVDKTGPTITAGPTVAGATLTATATDTSAIAAGEWFTGTDPGVGNATAMTVSGSTLSATNLPTGTYSVSVRAKDAAGNWGPAKAANVTVTKPVLFADGFESGTTSAWSAIAGPVTASATAKLAGSYGLAASMGAAPGSATPAYVQDNTPANAASYNASFQFRRNTLTPGNATVTVFQALSGAGTPVLAVQFRRVQGVNALRLGVTRAGGTTLTPWTVVSDAAMTVGVSWSSGLRATATLSVNGSPRSTLTRLNTSAYRVETVRLGVVAVTGRVSGVAWFDTFSSTL